MGEAVKAANGTEEFSGEDAGLNVAMMTENGLRLIEIGGSEFSLAGVFRLLAKEDLTRASDLAKSFKHDGPRAVATLALASAVFEKREKQPAVSGGQRHSPRNLSTRSGRMIIAHRFKSIIRQNPPGLSNSYTSLIPCLTPWATDPLPLCG
jgi:hypothetical protein